MKKLFLFMTLYLYISCALQCESEAVTDPSPERCHGLSLLKENDYCCYYEGKNSNTGLNEKFCWEYPKESIDNDGYKKVIEAIEKGTDSHVTKPHTDVELDCFSSYIYYKYLLIGLIILF